MGDPDHLDEIADGCGCTEVWEHLSEHRARASCEADGEDETAIE